MKIDTDAIRKRCLTWQNEAGTTIPIPGTDDITIEISAAGLYQMLNEIDALYKERDDLEHKIWILEDDAKFVSRHFLTP